MSDVAVNGRTVCDPQPCDTTKPIRCCRERSAYRSMQNGNVIRPMACDGDVVAVAGSGLSMPVEGKCMKCGLRHMVFVRDGRTLYGVLL